MTPLDVGIMPMIPLKRQEVEEGDISAADDKELQRIIAELRAAFRDDESYFETKRGVFFTSTAAVFDKDEEKMLKVFKKHDHITFYVELLFHGDGYTHKSCLYNSDEDYCEIRQFYPVD